MKILHVCQSDSHGGAAIAARRLHAALRAEGADSQMMVVLKTDDDPSVTAPLGQSGRQRIRLARFLAKRAARHDLGL